jgi:hypothetical protein
MQQAAFSLNETEGRTPAVELREHRHNFKEGPLYK